MQLLVSVTCQRAGQPAVGAAQELSRAGLGLDWSLSGGEYLLLAGHGTAGHTQRRVVTLQLTTKAGSLGEVETPKYPKTDIETRKLIPN